MESKSCGKSGEREAALTDVLSRCNMLMLEVQTRSFARVLVQQNESCDEISLSSREVSETHQK